MKTLLRFFIWVRKLSTKKQLPFPSVRCHSPRCEFKQDTFISDRHKTPCLFDVQQNTNSSFIRGKSPFSHTIQRHAPCFPMRISRGPNPPSPSPSGLLGLQYRIPLRGSAAHLIAAPLLCAVPHGVDWAVHFLIQAESEELNGGLNGNPTKPTDIQKAQEPEEPPS